MTRLFRSKSCVVGPHSIDSVMTPSTPHSPSVYVDVDNDDDEEEEEEEEDDEGYFGDFSSDQESENPSTTPFISPPARNTKQNQQQQFSVVALVAAALRRSLVTCSVDADDVASDVDIGFPTDVRHVSHVTFDRFNGFLGLPVELQPDVPRKPPSASASVFGVSAQSMQCSFDSRGNSVPTILLRMQSRLYSEGGLQAEGIFRINAENTQEEHVRDQLNRGVVPEGIDVHCLSGLIKAWFRELPSGVLDSLTPEQVMHCNTEEDCTQLVKLLPPTEATLLDWAINLMADVAQHEHHNKMNARNIAMVFAPNMTQMADPLTALIHAVQVMNFLKTLIMKNLRERQESEAAPATTPPTEYTNSVQSVEDSQCPSNTTIGTALHEQAFDDFSCKNDTFWSFRSKNDVGDKYEHDQLGKTSPVTRKRRTLGHSFKEEYENMEAEGILNRLSWRKGMEKLRRHPVFQLSKTVKKNGSVEL